MRKIEMKIGGSYNYVDDKSVVEIFNYNDIKVKEQIVENLNVDYDIEVEVEDIKEVIYKKHYENNGVREWDNFLIVDVDLVIELKFDKLSMNQLVLLNYWLREYSGEVNIDGIKLETNNNFDYLNNVDNGISYIVYDINAGMNWQGELNYLKHFDSLDENVLNCMNELLSLRREEKEEKEEAKIDLDEITNKIKELNEREKELDKAIQEDCEYFGIKNTFKKED